MTFPEFDEFRANFIAACISVGDAKGKEYAHGEDRFANFNRAAERAKTNRLVVAQIYRDKHIDSIASFISDRRTYSGENIRGRYTDAINYLILELGMIEEDMDKASAIQATSLLNNPPILYEVGETVQYIGDVNSILSYGQFYIIKHIKYTDTGYVLGLKVEKGTSMIFVEPRFICKVKLADTSKHTTSNPYTEEEIVSYIGKSGSFLKYGTSYRIKGFESTLSGILVYLEVFQDKQCLVALSDICKLEQSAAQDL